MPLHFPDAASNENGHQCPNPLAAQKPAVANHRECGQCTACCTVMGVGRIDKPAGQACQHSLGGKCAIYQVRPRACAEFICLWLADKQDLLGPEHRPDRVGLLITGGHRHEAQQSIVVREVYPGAAEKLAGQYLIAFLRQFLPVTIVPATPQRLVSITVSNRPVSPLNPTAGASTTAAG